MNHAKQTPRLVRGLGSPIAFNKPYLTGNEKRYLTSLIDQGSVGSDGAYTARCIQVLKNELGVPSVLLVPSGTAALEMAATLCELGPGDEVILPSFTFSSTANAIMRTGARPVFADIRADTMNIDERKIEEHRTAKTSAIVAVHYGGVSCEMDAITAISKQHKLLVIEDAAQAVNSWYKGRACGSLGHFGAFSFHSTKDYTCGEGGALCIGDPRFVPRAEWIRDKGTNRATFIRGEVDKYTWVEVGSSYVPSELTSAYLLAQLEAMNVIKQKRRAVYFRYREQLERLEREGLLRLPVIPPHCDTNGHMFYILLPDMDTRDRLLQHFRQQRVEAHFHYVPLHLSPMGRELGYRPGDFPVTEEMSGRLLRLPISASLTEQEQRAVVASLNRFLRPAVHKPTGSLAITPNAIESRA